MEPDQERALVAAAVAEFGGRLAGAVARCLPLNVGSEQFDLAESPSRVLSRARALASDMGELVEETSSAVSWVAVGGASNPAVVTVTATGGPERATVGVRAAAAEGLIKQRTGEALASRAAAALMQGSPAES